jgi:hypothetical protein
MCNAKTRRARRAQKVGNEEKGANYIRIRTDVCPYRDLDTSTILWYIVYNLSEA